MMESPAVVTLVIGNTDGKMIASGSYLIRNCSVKRDSQVAEIRLWDKYPCPRGSQC